MLEKMKDVATAAFVIVVVLPIFAALICLAALYEATRPRGRDGR